MNVEVCKVCGYEKFCVYEDNKDLTFYSCGSCGINADLEYENLTTNQIEIHRKTWIEKKDCKWQGDVRIKPNNWNPQKQMENSGLIKHKQEKKRTRAIKYKLKDKKEINSDWFNLNYYDGLTFDDLKEFYLEVEARFQFINETVLWNHLLDKNKFTDFFNNNLLDIDELKFNRFFEERLVRNKKQRHPFPHELFIFHKKKKKEKYPSIKLLTYQKIWECNKWLHYNLNDNKEFYTPINQDEKRLIDLRKSLLLPIFDNSKSAIDKLNSGNNKKPIKNEIDLLISNHTKDYFKKSVYSINNNQLKFSNKCIIEINIDSDSEVLLQEFKKFINELKTSNKKTLHGRVNTTGKKRILEKNFNQVNHSLLEDFKKYRVLECFDLMSYFSIKKEKVAVEQIAKFLFPDIKDSKDKYYKYTKKYVDEVFSFRGRNHLYHHVKFTQD